MNTRAVSVRRGVLYDYAQAGVLQLGHMGALVLLLEKPYMDLHSGYTGRYSYQQ